MVSLNTHLYCSSFCLASSVCLRFACDDDDVDMMDVVDEVASNSADIDLTTATGCSAQDPRKIRAQLETGDQRPRHDINLKVAEECCLKVKLIKLSKSAVRGSERYIQVLCSPGEEHVVLLQHASCSCYSQFGNDAEQLHDTILRKFPHPRSITLLGCNVGLSFIQDLKR